MSDGAIQGAARSRVSAVEAMKASGLRRLDELPVRVATLKEAAVVDELERLGLVLSGGLIASAVAALRSGKHLMLRGAPGTGKTTLAGALARAAHREGISADPILTTGTSDWTSVETVGAYRLTPDNQLEFRPGHVLAAMGAGAWLIIDELNRADIDKAIGQLFTVLSGHAVTLPFQVPSTDATTSTDDAPPEYRSVAIVPEGTEVPADSVPVRVSGDWRLIATLNNQDQDLLFEMSEALMRRFAVLDVPTPSDSQWIKIMQNSGGTSLPAIDSAFTLLFASEEFRARPLGAAVVLDAVRYIRYRLDMQRDSTGGSLDGLDPVVVLDEALAMYILPQMSPPGGEPPALTAATLLEAAHHDEPG